MTIEHSVIGKLILMAATQDEASEELTPATYEAGWHVNVTELLPEFESFQVHPEHPYRVYAGAVTVFLRFDNEDQWLTYLSQITA